MVKLIRLALLPFFVLLFLLLSDMQETFGASPTASLQSTCSSSPSIGDCGLGWHYQIEPPYGPFESIDALASDDIWLGGYYPLGNRRLFHWDGSTWTYSPLVGGGRSGGEFTDFASSASNDVWAVGWDTGAISGFNVDVVEHWNGISWTDVTCANCDPTIGPFLEGVSIVSPGTAWAVGNQARDAMSTNGAVLRCSLSSGCTNEIPIPDSSNGLNDLTSFGPNNVWAVGATYVTTPTHTAVSLILYWNGAAWATIAPPDVGELTAISALAPDNMWAIGTDGILHWDGTAWSQTSSVGGKHINAIHPSDVWAVGHTLQHWDGSVWNMVSSPEGLTKISAVSSSDLWATSTNGHVMRDHLAIDFADVPPDNTFHQYIACMSCQSIISGYSCGGQGEPCDAAFNPYFRPNSLVTRGQLAKIVTLSAYYTDTLTPTLQTFEDVPPANAFHQYVERLYVHEVVQGYTCGQIIGEPCVPPENRPYFRPISRASRGELAKLAANAAGLTDTVPPGQYAFEDVPEGSAFHLYVERLLIHKPGAMSGYPCGGPGEPCDDQNRPYFRPNNEVTRGQTSKIISNTFFRNCQTTAPTLKK